jgi:hypothetical protein
MVPLQIVSEEMKPPPTVQEVSAKRLEIWIGALDWN